MAKRRVALLGIPIVLLTIVAVFTLPVIIEARQAYDQIFVTPLPRLNVALNAEGTPVIVEATGDATTVAAADADVGGPDGGLGEPGSGAGDDQVVPQALATPESSPSPTPTPDPAELLPDWGKKERVNILLLGSDARDDGLPGRSDTMIILTVNPATKQVSMLSVPRDLLVTIPNYGNDKINAAYAYGSSTNLTGAGLARATVEYNFGITVDYFVEVDTKGFERIVDTLGGVTIDVPAPIKDDAYPAEGTNYTRVYFGTGLQHLNGRDALRYARTRHDDNDFARGNRQQQVLRALREQSLSLNLLSKAPQLLSQLGDAFRTDLSPRQALALAKLGASIDASNIHSYNLLDATSVQFAPGQPYYLIPNWNRINAILNEMMSR